MKNKHKIAYVYWGKLHPRRELCVKEITDTVIQLKESRFHPIGEMAHAFLLARKLKGNDVILVDGIIALEVAYFYKKFFNKEAKVIFYVVDPTFYPPYLNKPIRKQVYMQLAFCVDGFLVTTKMMYDDVRAAFPVAPIEYAPSFLWRESNMFRLSPSMDVRTFSFIAHNRVEKSFDIVKKTMRSFPQSKLSVLGRGFDDEKKGNVEKNISYIGETNNVGKYLSKSMFLLHPARFDPSPNVLYEALSVGVLPLVTKSCGNYTIVEAVDKRLILKSANVEILKKKIQEVQTWKKSELQKLSQKAKKEAKKHTKGPGLRKFKSGFTSLLRQIAKK